MRTAGNIKLGNMAGLPLENASLEVEINSQTRPFWPRFLFPETIQCSEKVRPTATAFKLRGEWAELLFMTRAAEHGLRVIKPWGDSSRYDFVVETGGRFLRVQVKSTSCRRSKHYVCCIESGGQKCYTADDIDFFAIYVIPVDTWYIIPIEVAPKLDQGDIICRRTTRFPSMLSTRKRGICCEGSECACAVGLHALTRGREPRLPGQVRPTRFHIDGTRNPT